MKDYVERWCEKHTDKGLFKEAKQKPVDAYIGRKKRRGWQKQELLSEIEKTKHWNKEEKEYARLKVLKNEIDIKTLADLKRWLIKAYIQGRQHMGWQNRTILMVIRESKYWNGGQKEYAEHKIRWNK